MVNDKETQTLDKQSDGKNLPEKNILDEESEIHEEPTPEELAKLADDQEASFSAPRIIEKPISSDNESKKSNQPKYAQVVAVSFHRAGKLYDFDAHEFNLIVGEDVIVETEEGLGFAKVVIAPRNEDIQHMEHPLRKVLRKATFDDAKQRQKNEERQKRAFQECTQKIRSLKLPMKLVWVDFLHSGSKAIFFFTSENRVDFRQLVRELAQEFHTRIEMRQIGPRDETKMVGGIGVCGRELCCTTWLRDFDPISIKMAKSQDLSLNPSKLAGQCGRLKCCLAYEYETYEYIKKGLPKLGKKVCYKDGSPCGKVIGHNIFSQTLRIEHESGGEKMVPLSEVVLASKFLAEGNNPPPTNNANGDA